ncbi:MULTISPECIES: sensor histidine kinase [Micromonospora]|uniref:histidine kinase n=1 Tax=Micromonospora solifontis TaxID=2487138 RepID=A0ABX9WLF2_9ACTN|nr:MULTISPECIES: sensor histidine kinase [Micromonospora]NES12485.1 sensor histidine kinase [Micromonospora sp. PPF5-17B]NES36070.1 sensor histidine kinase [Micromonospora solifontis]NES54630.1 sensor histidine kinase [Micromonospora sp. PPF5-6]RNL99991.1 sensor histidine kinase [Micromonospora solifontis]
MTAVPLATRPTPTTPVRGLVRQLLRDSGYVLFGLPLALVGFVVAVAGISLTAGLLVTTLGLPVLAGTLYAARALADIERLRLPAVLRQPRIRPVYLAPEPRSGYWRRILTPMRDPQSWLDLLHAFVKLLVALPTFVLVVVWWAVGLTGTLTVAYDWAIPRGPGDQDLSELLGMGEGAVPRIVLNTAIGIFFLLTLPLLARGCARTQAGLARSLLTGVAEMRNRISTLEDQKRAAASAEASALRRLERDIHDGPQQRLVRLAMDLGRARQQLAADPEAARRTLDEAVAQTRETLDELRALSRGIAPPILVDRGLPSALAALAARALVPTELVVDDDLGTSAGRLDPAVESTAYFVVAEALTNVAKHSAATACRVEVARKVGRLEIDVRDDGVGGAHLAKGHGLSGIADRVRAAGGTLEVASPAGGPTVVRAELPR